MKRVATMAAALLLVTVGLAMAQATARAAPAQQVGPVTLTITETTTGLADATGVSGGQLTMDLSATSTTAVAGMQFDLLFDPAVVSVASVTFNLPAEFLTIANTGTPGQMTIVLASATAGGVATLDVADVAFNLIGSSGATTALRFQNVIVSDASAEPLAAASVDGSITLADTPPPTPTPTGTPGPTPRPTPTPFPPLTVIPAEDITLVESGEGAITVIQPTSRADIALPRVGFTLAIPAPVQQTTFQVRVRAVAPETLAVTPEGRIVRVVAIDLFDTQGNSLDDTIFWRPATLTFALTPEEVEELGGLAGIIGAVSSRRLQIRRLDETRQRPSSAGLTTRFDIGSRSLSALTSRFSTFAVVYTEPGAALPLTGDPGIRRLVNRIALAGAFAVAVGVLLLVTARMGADRRE